MAKTLVQRLQDLIGTTVVPMFVKRGGTAAQVKGDLQAGQFDETSEGVCVHVVNEVPVTLPTPTDPTADKPAFVQGTDGLTAERLATQGTQENLNNNLITIRNRLNEGTVPQVPRGGNGIAPSGSNLALDSVSTATSSSGWLLTNESTLIGLRLGDITTSATVGHYVGPGQTTGIPSPSLADHYVSSVGAAVAFSFRGSL